jgi:hypothetical protein
MLWKGVAVTEQRQRSLEDYQLNETSITELLERFCISRKAAYKWINRFKQDGHKGFHELFRKPRSCPCCWRPWPFCSFSEACCSSQIPAVPVAAVPPSRSVHSARGPKNLLDWM